jgi:hypothetical protein
MPKYIEHTRLRLFIISFMVFIVLNMIENYIHYNIGRNRDSQYIELSMPSTDDWLKIVIIMICFATLQAYFTYMLD